MLRIQPNNAIEKRCPKCFQRFQDSANKSNVMPSLCPKCKRTFEDSESSKSLGGTVWSWFKK